MKKQTFFKNLSSILAVIMLATLIPAVIAVLSMQIIPMKYLWVALPIYVALTAVVALLLVNKKIRGAWLAICFLLALALCGVNIKIYMMSQATRSFIESLQQPKTSFVEYSIIAKKGGEITLDDGSSAGLISSDPLHKSAIEALANETQASVQDYDNLTSVVDNLMNQQVEMAAIRSANLSLIEENVPEIYEKIVVLGKFLVKGEQKESTAINMTRPFVVYVSGIDTYGQIDSVSRSDVNMLMVVNPADRKMLLVNTPRDYYVQLHGKNGLPDKLTHAGAYGIDVSRQTLEDLYGVEVPHYVRLNFTSLVKLIDTIGDIEVNSEYDFNSFKRGVNVLDSKRALEFARERYSFQDGDRQRGKNQQLVIEAVVAKLSEPSNITRYTAILNALEGSVQTDISEQSIREFVHMQLDDMKQWQIESVSVDGFGDMRSTYSMGDMPLYVMMPDQQTVDAARSKINKYLTD